MSTERDELARELFIADNFNQPREQSIVDWQWFMETPRFTVRIERYKAMAEGVIAAGYRKPRQITTVEELDALAVGSIIHMSNTKAPFLFTGDGWEATRNPGKPVWDYTSNPGYLPATVLWEPLP